MTHRIKIAASVAAVSVTFFAVTKNAHFENKLPEKNQNSFTPSPKLPEGFKYDGAQRMVR